MTGSSANTDTKVAVVTGASSGIGAAVADMLAGRGFKVIGIGREFTGNESFETRICDLTDEDKTEELVNEILAGSEVSVLVNNAGVGYYGLHGEIAAADIRRMVRTNLELPMVLTNLFLPSIKCSKGWIINISSITAGRINTHGAAYGATKAGLSSFCESLYEEYRKQDVKVVTIRPDMTKTDLYRNADFQCSDAQGAYLLPSDVATVIGNILDMREGAVVRDVAIMPQYHRIERK